MIFAAQRMIFASGIHRVIMRDDASGKETSDVVPEGETDSQSQTGRLSLPGLWLRSQAEEETLQSEKGERIVAGTWYPPRRVACRLRVTSNRRYTFRPYRPNEASVTADGVCLLQIREHDEYCSSIFV
jgi:hypothetical protein